MTIRLKKPKPRTETIDWPVLKMSSWVQTLTKPEYARFLLGGHAIDDVDGWKMMFANFWHQYRSVNPSHPVFSSGIDTAFFIPFALHGDEGRGLRGKPYLVESWQPLIGVGGPFVTNESGSRG